MTASSYDVALARLLVHEGGYTNHPRDPGGPTNWGITIHDYRKYVNSNATAVDIRTMPLATAKRIYRERYWNPMRCDELPAGVDDCVFDYAVNSGTGRAPKVLQRCLGLAANGRMDDATLRAAARVAPPRLINAICDERLRFLQSLRTWDVFGNGWARRVREVRAAALAMAEKNVAVAPSRPELPLRTPAPGKGTVPINTSARKTTAGGTLAAGGAAATQSHEPATIVMVLMFTIAVAIGAWWFWRWWQRRQQDAAH
jgi:lysozyme family protein